LVARKVVGTVFVLLLLLLLVDPRHFAELERKLMGA